uniref:MH1 domain-containing protein n=1 Tax=Meloidogyne incognita TaxID=6306 RepID=A0A914NGR3_MELIC
MSTFADIWGEMSAKPIFWPMSMPYLCCKMWRWKDLQVDAALHRLDPLPWCRFGRVTINNATVSCCNPYHYALWIRPETISSDEQSISSGVLANGGGGATARLSSKKFYYGKIPSGNRFRQTIAHPKELTELSESIDTKISGFC